MAAITYKRKVEFHCNSSSNLRDPGANKRRRDLRELTWRELFSKGVVISFSCIQISNVSCSLKIVLSFFSSCLWVKVSYKDLSKATPLINIQGPQNSEVTVENTASLHMIRWPYELIINLHELNVKMIMCYSLKRNEEQKERIITFKPSVSWRPWSPSFWRVHLFSACFFFEKGGKPVTNLPMKYDLSVLALARTLYSCKIRTRYSHWNLKNNHISITTENGTNSNGDLEERGRDWGLHQL